VYAVKQKSCGAAQLRYKVHFGVVVAISLVVTDLVCLHDVSLMYTCVESAYGVEGKTPAKRVCAERRYSYYSEIRHNSRTYKIEIEDADNSNASK
jgi:hypothetical protein